MGQSLQDQLFKAGLVDAGKAKKAKSDKHKQNKVQRKNKINTADENRSRLERQQREKAEKDRELNRKREEKAARKQLNAQIKQLIEENRVEQGEEGEVYNFQLDGKIKRIYVSAEVREQLIKGVLTIVTLNGRYELVPNDIAEKIKERDERRVVSRGGADSTLEEDDAYADYKVPDDLMW